MINDNVQVIEVSAELLKKQIRRYNDLQSLYQNPAFKEVILEGYFKDLATNTVMLKADKHMQEPEQQKDLDNQLMGIASLNEYFNVMKLKSDRAEMDLAADAITLDELREEEI